jgi:hypothetical protein
MEGGALYSRSPHAKSMAHRSRLRRTVVLCPRETWGEKTMHTVAGCITVSIDDSRRAIGHELLAWGRAALAPAILRSNVTASLRSRLRPSDSVGTLRFLPRPGVTLSSRPVRLPKWTQESSSTGQALTSGQLW